MAQFSSLGIRQELIEALRIGGITSATPVQLQAIPVILSGKDTMAQAQTGTGKTLAFVLPILEKIQLDKPYIQALIVTPTRELAIQITDEIQKLAGAVGAKVLAAYGGQDVEAQIRKLKNPPHIVVATPGRLLDHLRRDTLRISGVSMLVLDEADQMLHMGFLPGVEAIIEQTPETRQTLLFSATLSGQVRQLAQNYMRRPQDIRIEGKQTTLEGIKQMAVDTTDRGKLATLVKMIEVYRPYLAVVFCRTKIRAKKLTEQLVSYGIEADELHGDLSQAKREQVMRRFREAKLQVLVATDVAARGLDVEGVTHVFNYDIPQDAESYIHRIGRTGRAGQEGAAVTFVSPRDRSTLQLIEKGIHMMLKRRSMSEFIDVKEMPSEPSEKVKAGPRGRSAGSMKKDGGKSRSGRSDRGGSRRGATKDSKPGRNAPKGNPRGAKSAEGSKTGRRGRSSR
ncbi:DEAD/DEAH box helicase [Marinicrinis lubricantis]|uniref:DEAD/DEAH box helicase n=1 Tax=Marinicrinis lubricantis TaxID=2086470 RepID=A0ABW1ILW9_9BACL